MKTWTDVSIEGYRDYAINLAEKYLNKNKIDCANLAIEALFKFAFSSNLPVQLLVHKGKTKEENKYVNLDAALYGMTEKKREAEFAKRLASAGDPPAVPGRQ